MMDIQRLAWAFIEELPQETLDHHIVASSDEKWGQDRTFDDMAVEVIATELQAFIASVIASLIDAGSEREAIMEDEMLSAELTRLLKDW